MVAFGILALTKTSLAYQPRGAGGAPLDRGAARAKTGKSANETYIVIQIGEEISVIAGTDKNSTQKKYDESYKRDLKNYQDTKKDKNNHDPNTLKKPDKKDYTIKVLKGNFKTQEDAQKFADEKIKERDKDGKKTGDDGKKW